MSFAYATGDDDSSSSLNAATSSSPRIWAKVLAWICVGRSSPSLLRRSSKIGDWIPIDSKVTSGLAKNPSPSSTFSAALLEDAIGVEEKGRRCLRWWCCCCCCCCGCCSFRICCLAKLPFDRVPDDFSITNAGIVTDRPVNRCPSLAADTKPLFIATVKIIVAIIVVAMIGFLQL